MDWGDGDDDFSGHGGFDDGLFGYYNSDSDDCSPCHPRQLVPNIYYEDRPIDTNAFYCNSSSEEEDGCQLGKLVERFDFPKRVSDAGAKDVDSVDGESHRDEDMWTTMPDGVMRSIVYCLPFSAFCSFRSIGKKWNKLVSYPDASLMNARNSREVPLCVLPIGNDMSMCYNPVLHSWCRLPGNFGSSFGALGFSGDQCKVRAGTDGLLVVESAHMGLWVVNPVNKTERRIAEDGRCARILKVHIHLNAEISSYKVLVLSDVRPEMDEFRIWGPILALRVYDSVTDCWHRDIDEGDVEEFQSLCSVVDYGGVLCCLLADDLGCVYSLRLQPDPKVVFSDYELEFSDSETQEEQFRPSFGVADRCPELPMDLEAGQLFVLLGCLLLGGVATDKTYLSVRAYIWRLDKRRCRWIQICRMQLKRFGLYSFSYQPVVSIRGEYMWITDWDSHSVEIAWIGVMCHIPSNTWWKLPNLSDSPQLGLKIEQDPGASEGSSQKPKKVMKGQRASAPCYYGSDSGGDDADYKACMPFMFEPRMGLVA